MAGRIYPMGLMFGSILLLIMPGLMFNNFTSSNLTEPNEPNLSCPGFPNITCQGSVNVGCQAVTPTANPCTVNGASISFLNQQSPFTALVQGNLFGFFKDIISPTLSNNLPTGPFDIVGGGSYIRANCVVTIAAGGGALTAWGFTGPCTEANTDNSNATATCSISTNCASTWNNWNTKLNGATATARFFNLANSSSGGNIGVVCQYQSQTNYTFAGAGFSGWTYYGCDYYTPVAGGCCTNAQAISKQIFSILYAVPYAIGKLTGGYTCSIGAGTCFHVHIYAQLENWDTFNCINFFNPGNSAWQSANAFYSSQCQKYLDTLKSLQSSQSGQPGGGANNFNFGFLTPVLTFLVGLVLFFIGLGIQLGFGGNILGTGVQGSIGANRQGTKLAQVVGIGLLVFSPMYSEFSTWFTSGYFPYGLDGSTGIISFVVIGLFFGGVFWEATQS